MSLSPFSSSIPWKEIKNLLNYKFHEKITFHDLIACEPKLFSMGRYAADQKLKGTIGKDKLITNELHAILSEDNFYPTSNSNELKYKEIWYSEIQGLRKRGVRPKVITANVLAVDSNKKGIILHRRSTKSSLYPGKLSIVGGGFLPFSIENKVKADKLLKDTAIREFNEETNMRMQIDKDTKITLTEEITSGNIQINYLGAKSEWAPARMDKESIDFEFEGEPVFVSFNKLNDYLNLDFDEWTPLGKSNVLAWLALGASGTGEVKFGGISAAELFREHI